MTRTASFIVALAALSLAAPATAQDATPYARAIAAGYKALTLCEGVLSAGRTEAQVNATESIPNMTRSCRH